MLVMLCRNRVADFAKWKAVFDSHTAQHRAAGLRLRDLWHDIADPNNFYFVFEVADLDKARAFVTAPRGAEIGKEAGVLDGEYHFLESDV